MATSEPRPGTVRRQSRFTQRLHAAFWLLLLPLAGCGLMDGAAGLSKSDDDEASLPSVPAPPENGPKLGSIAHRTPVLERPSTKSKPIGQLHAGALVARTATPVRTSKDCKEGYYAIFPRGYVCLNQGGTLDLAHPTLVAMAIRPAADQPLPYAYARTTVETELLERDPSREAVVRATQKLAKGSGFAVVGSWTARIGEGEPERLGLLMNGRFVRAQHLTAAESSEFSGYEVGGDKPLPVAFVVKRGVRQYKMDGDGYAKDELLDYHATVPLSGRFRTIDGVKFWMTADKERGVRNQDVTVITRRTKFPDFARENQRWLDVGVIMGTVVAYEGQKPIFATLLSSGRDRLGTPELEEASQAITKLGTFEIVSKSVTLLDAAPERMGERYSLFDIPWALELSSGQYLLGAYWHDRFGIEHGPGDLMLAPADAQRLWNWATPELPKGWHTASASGDKTIVHVHK